VGLGKRSRIHRHTGSSTSGAVPRSWSARTGRCCSRPFWAPASRLGAAHCLFVNPQPRTRRSYGTWTGLRCRAPFPRRCRCAL